MLDYRIIRITAILTVFHSTISEHHVQAKNDPHGKSDVKDRNLAIQRVTTNDSIASVHCPALKDDEENVRISLHRNTSELHSTDFRRTQALNNSDLQRRFHVSIENNTVHYLISLSQANDTSLYCCEVQHGTTDSRKVYTLLLVKDAVPFCPYEGGLVYWLMLTAGLEIQERRGQKSE
ncbi:uncharacterized protein LOC118810304 isoform X2 [Colossoma macropomum]|uniref:uncharacterized protein LOC118810304 isoform X2 n=1 Tax=Colossoma macropomum TaxID=42526 RepID=UPI0018654FF3|nr:uncharacterized protein LOC118810304 isoform X2 [Colossoma macropomum]